MSENMYVNGEAVFVNLDKTEEYMGQDTGKYSIVVRVSDDDAAELEAAGIKLRDYEGTKQRKFTTKYKIKVVDKDGETMSPADVTWGSKVRVKYAIGTQHPVHGAIPYINALKVLELAEPDSGDDEF